MRSAGLALPTRLHHLPAHPPRRSARSSWSPTRSASCRIAYDEKQISRGPKIMISFCRSRSASHRDTRRCGMPWTSALTSYDAHTLSRYIRPSWRRKARWRSGTGNRRRLRIRSNSLSGRDCKPLAASMIDSIMSPRCRHAPRVARAASRDSATASRCCTPARMMALARAGACCEDAPSMRLRVIRVRGGVRAG